RRRDHAAGHRRVRRRRAARARRGRNGMTDPRGVGRVLIRCLQAAGTGRPPADLVTALTDVDLDRLVEEGVRQRVAGALLTTLAGVPGLPPEPIDRLREVTTANVVWQLVLNQ